MWKRYEKTEFVKNGNKMKKKGNKYGYAWSVKQRKNKKNKIEAESHKINKRL